MNVAILQLSCLAILVHARRTPSFHREFAVPIARETFASLLLSFSPAILRSARYKTSHPSRSQVRAQYGSSKQDKFLGAQVFDALSLRTFRRDTLAKYDEQNQSEPLRIALTLIGILFSLSFPSLAADLRIDDELTANVAAVMGTFISGFFLFRNTNARKSRLEKLERENALSDLSILFRGVRQISLRELRKRNRLVIVSGSQDDVRKARLEACVYRRRLVEAQAIFVPVQTGSNIGSDADIDEASGAWLYSPFDTQSWLAYFDNLLSSRNLAGQSAWIGINKKGATFGSGLGTPSWDEMLGTSMQPIGDGFGLLPERNFPAAEAAKEGATAAASLQGSNSAVAAALQEPSFTKSVEEHGALLDAQVKFYAALTSSDLDAMKSVWTEDELAVDDIITNSIKGVAPWSVGSSSFPPAGLRATDCDALILPTGEAWTTAIERPEGGGTLLATQKWRKDSSGNWRLEQHRYIPWTASGGTAVLALRCDRRGCLLLGREIDQPA